MMDSEKPLKVGIAALEASADILGAEFIEAFRQLHPKVEFVGIAGPKMLTQGCKTLFPQEELSVMGFGDVLKKIPYFLTVRKKLIEFFQQEKIDVFLGIDAPDFNLTLEEKLKAKGIPTVHYVSPTVWAWRKGRIKKIKRACDLMLTLFPFEADFYQEHAQPSQFVGHPLADKISLETDKSEQRKKIGIHTDDKIIALLPGSRESEIEHMAPLFIETAKKLWTQDKNIQFLVPMVNEKRKAQFNTLLKSLAPELPVKICENSQEVMGAADSILLKSGTSTLEAMLLKKPMVVAYKTSGFNYLILKCLVRVPYIALPNILANKAVVPEFIQDSATVDVLSETLLQQLNNKNIHENMLNHFDTAHKALKQNSSHQAAEAVLKIITNSQ